MTHRIFHRGVLLISGALFFVSANAGLDDLLKSAGGLLGNGGSALGLGGQQAGSLTNQQIDRALKQALSVGAERAVALLGEPGGFLNDPSVRIPLPGILETAGNTLRKLGQGRYVDDFETTVNRAAEQAVPKTLEIVKQAVRSMTLEDVRGILEGGDDAATKFLRERAGENLHQAVKPIIARATDKAGATAAYKNLVDRAGSGVGGLLGGLGGMFGKSSSTSLDLDEYVTGKTMDGLFMKLAAEEKAVRENPLARTTDLMKKVFAN